MVGDVPVEVDVGGRGRRSAGCVVCSAKRQLRGVWGGGVGV